MTQSGDGVSSSPETVPVCYRHPSRETYVRCTRCNRSICPDCMKEAAVGFQCPECVAEGRKTQRPARTAFGGGSAGQAGYVTKALIGLNVLAALVGVLLAGSGALIGGGLFTGATKLHLLGSVVGPSATVNSDGGVYYGVFPDLGEVYTGVYDGAYYRLITAMFIHYGLLHLLMNMWALWFLGRNLETALGPIRFLALYLLAGIGGNVAALLWSPESFTAGASTALFGLFAAFFVLLRRLKRDTSSVLPVLLVNLVITFAVPGISIAGHLGGMVTGALLAAVLAYAPQKHRTAVQAAGMALVFAVLAALSIAAG